MRGLVGGLHQLPSTQQLHRELIQAVTYPDLGLDELASIIEQDATMAAKVLQLVNSSFFGLARRQTCIWEAVSYLGTELLKDLTLHAGVFDSMTLPPLEGFSLEHVQRHSLMSARIAQRLMTDKARQSEAYAAALLHDVGKIVLALVLPERYASVLRDCRETRRDDHVVELERLGVTHAEVGAYLLALWGLPLTLVEAVAHHHHPERAGASDLTIAVHAASAFSHSGDPTNRDDATLGGRLNVAYIADTRFGRELARWRTEAADEQQRACGEG
jgi:putative nucleotidyltransferase with HDIG domain